MRINCCCCSSHIFAQTAGCPEVDTRSSLSFEPLSATEQNELICVNWILGKQMTPDTGPAVLTTIEFAFPPVAGSIRK